MRGTVGLGATEHVRAPAGTVGEVATKATKASKARVPFESLEVQQLPVVNCPKDPKGMTRVSCDDWLVDGWWDGGFSMPSTEVGIRK